VTRITGHQLDVLYRRWRLGSDEAVAADMGISRHTVRNTLYLLRMVLNAEDTMQCTWLLRDDLAAFERRAQIRVAERHDTHSLRKQNAVGGVK